LPAGLALARKGRQRRWAPQGAGVTRDQANTCGESGTQRQRDLRVKNVTPLSWIFSTIKTQDDDRHLARVNRESGINGFHKSCWERISG
jgi:hypothetical protein